MTKPTDPEINAALARALGYTVVFVPGEVMRYELTRADGRLSELADSEAEAWGDAPLFCSDRRHLPEILAAVERAGKRQFFMAELYQDGRVWPNLWEVLALPPRAYAVAALKALGGWPEGWGGEETDG